MMHNSKGNIASFIFIGVGLLILAITIGFSALFIGEFDTAMSNTKLVQEEQAEANITGHTVQAGYSALAILDMLFIFVLFGFCIASLVGAFFVDSHPIFFIFTVIISFFLAFISGMYSNIFFKFAETSQFAPIFENYTTILFVFENLPLIMVAMSIIVGIFTVSKTRYFG